MDGSKTLWQAFSVVLLLWTSAPPLSAALFSDLEGVSGTENNFPWEIKEEKGVPELRCYLPGPPINGSVSIWGGGLLIEYMCDEGFISVGDMIGACDYSLGIWTIDSPLCVGSDCPVPTRFPHGTIRMQHENGLATFDCHPGYHLYGSRVLRCMGKKWNSSQPTCLRNVDGNRSSIIDLRPIDPVRVRLERKKENITNLMESDESCHRQGISPPKIQHATGRTSYYYNTFRKIYVMLATYTCGDDYKLEHEDMKHLYCKNFRWVAPIKPKCVKRFTACEKRNGGCQHICVPESGRYSCACNSGYTLAPNRKSCIDMDECIFDNGLCQQECYNTIGSYFCACAEGFDQTGKSCTVSPQRTADAYRTGSSCCDRRPESNPGGNRLSLENLSQHGFFSLSCAPLRRWELHPGYSLRPPPPIVRQRSSNRNFSFPPEDRSARYHNASSRQAYKR